eukprot:TRINITY_DN4533_c1_g2_i2.p1 TRINITY_DN4533_c1_g2~~TRINITY_DN4533_c1_g2_i2.p1  ORF type:complete len:252 (+),score=46.89 TRINITY_DN4533_c1_g2_i2:162-917(+)
MVNHSRSASPQYYDHTLTKADRDTMAEVGRLAEGLLANSEANQRGRGLSRQTPSQTPQQGGHMSVQLPVSPDMQQAQGFHFSMLSQRPHSMRAIIAQVSILAVVVTLCLVFLEEGYLPDMKTETLKLDALHSISHAMSEKSMVCALTTIELRSEANAISAQEAQDINNNYYRMYQSIDILPLERLRKLCSERGVSIAVITGVPILTGAHCSDNEDCNPTMEQLRSAIDNPRALINKYAVSAVSKCFSNHLS